MSPLLTIFFILISYDFRTFSNNYCHFKNKHAIFYISELNILFNCMVKKKTVTTGIKIEPFNIK